MRGRRGEGGRLELGTMREGWRDRSRNTGLLNAFSGCLGSGIGALHEKAWNGVSAYNS